MRNNISASSHTGKGSPKIPPRFLKFEQDSIEQSRSKGSKDSKSPAINRKPSHKHTQLIDEVNRLVAAKSSWDT